MCIGCIVKFRKGYTEKEPTNAMTKFELTNRGMQKNFFEQGNDGDERRQVAEENTLEEGLDKGEDGAAVVGRPQQQQRLPRRNIERYEMGVDFYIRYFKFILN